MSEATAKKPGFFARIAKFFREVKSEMKKVVWPTWSQTVNNTVIVIAVIIIVGVFLAIVDTLFGGVVRGVIIGDFGKAFGDMLKFQ